MIKELKAFLFRGNVIDLAVAVIIGSAFGAIVTSLVNDIITPLILNPALKAANVENITQLTWNGVKYGSFLGVTSLSLVLAFSLLSKLLKKQCLKNKRKRMLKWQLLLKKNCLLKSVIC